MLPLLLLLASLALLPPASPKPGPDAAGVGRLSTDLGARVFREVAKASPERNVAFSPFGVAAVLAMLQLGAAGDTRSQLEGALRFRLDERGVPRALRRLQRLVTEPRSGGAVSLADAVFVQRDLPLSAGFLPRFYRTFRQTVKQVDFAESERARGIVNDWVREHTRGMIQDFLPEGTLDERTRLVLVDAIHFKGLWSLPFPEASTRPRLFHKLDGSSTSVPMMEQTAKFNYGEFSTPEGLEYDVIELPYQEEMLSMLIAAPFGKDASISALSSRIDTQLVTDWQSRMARVTRLLVLPKFSLESETDLRRPLEALGVRDAFNASAANFSRLSGQESLFVAHALQKVKIDVSESGTEASSATAAVVYSRMAPLEVVLDRPFLFVVRHNPTGTLLFMGQVMEP